MKLKIVFSISLLMLFILSFYNMRMMQDIMQDIKQDIKEDLKKSNTLVVVAPDSSAPFESVELKKAFIQGESKKILADIEISLQNDPKISKYKEILENDMQTLYSDESFKLMDSRVKKIKLCERIASLKKIYKIEEFSDKNEYFLDEENEWLDITVQNILALENPYKKALAFWAIYQSCLIKRPYNLFHRKNLHIRTADVKRSFGNKTTWDKPFDLCFKKFIQEANNVVFDNHQNNLSLSLDACSLNYEQYPVDLVYIDPPYNTGSDGFLYNDNYQHSSWMTFISDRLSLSKKLISSDK